MAQLLIRIVDRTHPDPTVAATLYTRGDVVDVFPDGQLTVPQAHPQWAVLEVAGLEVEHAKAVLTAQDCDEDGVVIRRRLRALHWPTLPPAIRDALLTARHAALQVDDLRGCIRHKRTGATEDL